MTTTRIRAGRVSIPVHIRQAAHLEEGDKIEVEVTNDGILLRPIHEPELDLSWFESPEGEARLQEAMKAIQSGSQWLFESGEEFVATLERLAADDADV